MNEKPTKKYLLNVLKMQKKTNRNLFKQNKINNN